MTDSQPPVASAAATPSSKSCLTGGAIALGCLGALLFFAGIAILGFYFAGNTESDGEEEADGGGVLGRLFDGGAASAEPEEADFDGGRPVGLYFMTRFWSYTGSLEKSVWYFAPDGQVYRDLETGFSEADLAAHRGMRGVASVDGSNMTIKWSDGKSTTNDIEPDAPTFAWDGGIFTPVRPFGDADQLVANWEGGESLSHGGNSAAISKSLELRADGTFTWSSVAFVKGETNESELSGSAEGGTSGNWKLSGHSLVLTDSNGNTLRGIAFPYDDEETPVDPDRFFFRGTMYKQLR